MLPDRVEDHTGAAYSRIEATTLARSKRRPALGPPILGSILFHPVGYDPDCLVGRRLDISELFGYHDQGEIVSETDKRASLRELESEDVVVHYVPQ
ncbi:GL15393 [Drosophila persimilis]|uniref:GL15393 n=1 Tax=Drosophila persimilis TaxID=7234 RepID=B4IRI6_DROPE|nr:GL15393 [Drosophila persimilis]